MQKKRVQRSIYYLQFYINNFRIYCHVYLKVCQHFPQYHRIRIVFLRSAYFWITKENEIPICVQDLTPYQYNFDGERACIEIILEFILDKFLEFNFIISNYYQLFYIII